MAVPDRCYHCGRRGELEQHAVYDAEIAHLGDGWRQRVEERRRDVYRCRACGSVMLGPRKDDHQQFCFGVILENGAWVPRAPH